MGNYIYKSPIPFNGQKRYWIKDFVNVLSNFAPNGTYLDLFGGSGLLSHNIKVKYPEAKVIFNDYCNFYNRLKKIYCTDEILANITELINKSDVRPSARIDSDLKNQILQRLSYYVDKYSIDNIDFTTISSYILFGGNEATTVEDLAKYTFYYHRGVKAKKHKCCDDYLAGCQIVSKDFRDCYEDFKDEENLILILDPPYLSTDNSRYVGITWHLKDFLDVCSLMLNNPFIFFSSEKSEAKIFFDWCKLHNMNMGFLNDYNFLSKSYSLANTKQVNIRNDDMLFYSVRKV